jgi:hypothetical protein
MRSVLLYLTILVVAINSLLGLLISDYDLFNMLLFDASVVFPAASLYVAVGSESLEDPFKASLVVFSALSSAACCAMSLLSRASVYDNYYFIAIVTLIGTHIVLVNVLFVTSKSVEESVLW